MRRRWLPLTVLVVALVALVASVLWVFAGDRGMFVDGRAVVTGDGPVRDLDGARDAADRFADRLGLTVGEVMEFDNGFYAVLVDVDGEGSTEVLVDPDTGTTWLEYGPAMMWNTRYGMHRSGMYGAGMHGWRDGADWGDGPDWRCPGWGGAPGRAASCAAEDGPEQARRIADDWLRAERPGERAGHADAFPGYYTLHTERDGEVTGMLSVRCGTGDVWYHSWHGRFLRMD
ncbi:hypothetical protein [Haloechinothrix salitolerans]|uniref:Peptidase propeptide and YPEB domain-containing protein n=1 Tax=Haloechinothrix salitolerans TaxID=926830 RepID=A0ABW2CAH9_9PSEU